MIINEEVVSVTFDTAYSSNYSKLLRVVYKGSLADAEIT